MFSFSKSGINLYCNSPNILDISGMFGKQFGEKFFQKSSSKVQFNYCYSPTRQRTEDNTERDGGSLERCTYSHLTERCPAQAAAACCSAWRRSSDRTERPGTPCPRRTPRTPRWGRRGRWGRPPRSRPCRGRPTPGRWPARGRRIWRTRRWCRTPESSWSWNDLKFLIWNWFEIYCWK